MNYKYRKKPIIIEAFQMTYERRWDNSEWPQWLHKAWNLDSTDANSLYCNDNGGQLYINTLEGIHSVTPEDYIVQGIKGEIYPCKPDIFKTSYEKI